MEVGMYPGPPEERRGCRNGFDGTRTAFRSETTSGCPMSVDRVFFRRRHDRLYHGTSPQFSLASDSVFLLLMCRSDLSSGC